MGEDRRSVPGTHGIRHVAALTHDRCAIDGEVIDSGVALSVRFCDPDGMDAEITWFEDSDRRATSLVRGG
jgi:hypothetical protein